MSIEDSLIRVLRRDHDKKGYSFQSILHHRLREYYFILKLYLEPALQDPDTVLLSKAREVPCFLASEQDDILQSLESLRVQYGEDISLSVEHKEFIVRLIEELKTIFSVTPGSTELEMKLWRKQKSLKKYKRENKRRKKLPNETGLTREKLAKKIKKLKKEIGGIKKEISNNFIQ